MATMTSRVSYTRVEMTIQCKREPTTTTTTRLSDPSVNVYAQSSRELAAVCVLFFFGWGGRGALCCGPVSHSRIVAYKEDSSIVTKNATVVVKRVPAPKTGGLLAKMKALDAAAALQSTATYGYFCRKALYLFCVCVTSSLSLRFVLRCCCGFCCFTSADERTVCIVRILWKNSLASCVAVAKRSAAFCCTPMSDALLCAVEI